MVEKTKSKSKGKKIGRSAKSPSHMAYNAQGRRDKNHLRNLIKYLNGLAKKSIKLGRPVMDKQASKAYQEITGKKWAY